MHSHNTAKLNRFNKTSKALLVDFINAKNNRKLTPDQMVFGKPVLKEQDGLSEVEVSFNLTMGWGNAKRILGYYRVELRKELGNQPIVVHVPDDTEEGLLKAIREQYGILLEPEFITVELVTRSLPDATQNTDGDGFEGSDAPEGEDTEPEVPAYLENRNYRITFKEEHLIFFGEVEVFTRRSLEFLGNTIDSLLDLREFYRDGSFELPKVDTVIKNGEAYIDDVHYPDFVTRRHVCSGLYEIKIGTFIDLASILPEILKQLTQDEWVSLDKPDLPFNLYESEVIYNGYVSKDYTLDDVAYNYVLAVNLGQRCANLTGILKIGYQFSPSKTPANIPYNQASILPLHPR